MQALRESWRWLGVAALGAVAVAAIPTVLAGASVAWPWLTVFAFGAACLARRSVTHQVLGQGIALSLALSHGGAVLVALARPALFGTTAVLLGLAGVVATLAGLPFWRGALARERFAPLAYRPWFLAGAIGSVAIGMRFVTQALRDLGSGQAYLGVLGGVFAALLIAQATAVVRMRGWGVLVATATGAACVIPVWALSAQDARLPLLAILASACLVVPVLAARRTTRPRQQRVSVQLPCQRQRIEARELLVEDAEWSAPPGVLQMNGK